MSVSERVLGVLALPVGGSCLYVGLVSINDERYLLALLSAYFVWSNIVVFKQHFS